MYVLPSCDRAGIRITEGETERIDRVTMQETYRLGLYMYFLYVNELGCGYSRITRADAGNVRQYRVNIITVSKYVLPSCG